MRNAKSWIRAGLLLASLGLSNAVLAGPADYVYTPEVEKGEIEIDNKFGTAKGQDGVRKTVSTLGLGYGVTDYWFSEVYFKREKEGSDGLNIAEFENKFKLTETGQYFVDVGLITEIEMPLNNNKAPWEFKFGPLFQKEVGKVQLNANVLFERTFEGKGVTHVTELGYQWQAKYRLMKAFEFGLQGMGEVGDWRSWDKSNAQNHRMGPAVFGKVNVGPKQAIKYNAALLFGVSDVAPDTTFRSQVEFEF